MPTVPQIIKSRNRRRITEVRKPWPKVSLILATLISLLAVGAFMAGFFYFVNATQGLPSVGVLPTLLEPPNGILLQPTRLYDRSHQHLLLTLDNPSAAGKRYLKITGDDLSQDEKLSRYLIGATIVTFDPNFWHHSGFSLFGLSEGTHPTIAQKLISDLVLDGETDSLKRNLRERILAAQVTAKYGREKLLEWYLNSAQYGNLIYGADAAAHAYFGKSASDLSLAQAAMLAAISQTPAMGPVTVPRWLKAEQEKIIQAMRLQGLITEKEANEAMLEQIQFQDLPDIRQIAPAFTELVLKQLSTQLSMDRIRRGGFEIITTLDYDLLLQSNCFSRLQIAMLMDTSETATIDPSACDAANQQFIQSASDARPSESAQASVVILDPHTGQILSFTGEDTPGNSISFSGIHPVGTIISPFIYVSAFANGISPASMVWDIPANDTDQKYINAFHGPVRARIALVNDYLSATADILRQVGVENVLSTEESFGFASASQNLTTDADLYNLYSQQRSLLEVTSAYSVLANQGRMSGRKLNTTEDEGISPTSIILVRSVDGRVWLDWSSPQSRAITTPQLAYLATHVLSDESARVSNPDQPDPLLIDRPVAVKSGSSVDTSSFWTVGYTPDISIGVWIGSSDSGAGNDSTQAVDELWAALMRYTTRQMPVKEFAMPSAVISVKVCDPSGLLVSKLCPNTVEEVFLTGNEPHMVDNLYQLLQVNRQTGLLATAFTPPDMVEDRVYLMVPDHAAAWAKMANLPIPPDSYDEISSFIPASDDTHITSPQLFGFVSGKVSIFGSASGPDFANYRIEIGQGLNPQQWVQVGDEVTSPVDEGLLAVWDTEALEGSYLVRLLVARKDQRIDRAIVQVTVDNTLPQLKILSPTDHQKISYQQDGRIMIQVSAADNLFLDKIEYYIDGLLVSSLLQPPFVILYSMTKGEHILRVQAYDLAGNMVESSVSFTVE